MRLPVLFFVITTLVSLSIGCSKSSSSPNEEPDPPTPDPPAPAPVYFGQDTLGTWKVVASTQSSIGNVQFASNMNGFIVDNYYYNIGRYSTTTDGALSWSDYKPLPTATNVIKAPRPGTVYAYRLNRPLEADESTLALWQQNPAKETEWKQHFKTTQNRFTVIKNMVFPEDTVAYAVTVFGEFLKIKSPYSFNDSKLTKLSNVSETIYDVIDMCFGNGLTGWVAQYNNLLSGSPGGTSIYTTSNGGKTWDLQYENKQEILTAITAFDVTHAWFTTEGKVYRTENGGTSWSAVPLTKNDGSRVNITNILFVSREKGFLTSTNDIFVTTDGGKTWQRSLKDGKNYMIGLTYTKPGSLWAFSDKRVFHLAL